MDAPEAWQLLTLASAFDGRTVDKAVALAWADELASIDVFDAVDAMKAHYARETTWMMPAHIFQGVARIREAREREARINRPQLEARRITMPTDWRARCEWFINNPGKTADDYEEAHK